MSHLRRDNAVVHFTLQSSPWGQAEADSAETTSLLASFRFLALLPHSLSPELRHSISI